MSAKVYPHESNVCDLLQRLKERHGSTIYTTLSGGCLGAGGDEDRIQVR